MATKLYLSGGESHKHWLRLYDTGARNLLVSFYYLQDRAKDALRTRTQENPGVSLFVDSGGYTFQSQAEKYKWTKDDFKVFLEKYLKFLEYNKGVLNAAVEMDLEHVFGYGEIRKWQENYFAPIERMGVPIIYIWHNERGVGEWEEMCRRHRFVGINEEFFDSMSQTYLMDIAKKYLTKVHGFALTRQWVFQNMGLATADSATWKAAERYGTLFTFMDNKFRRHKPEQWRKQGPRFKKYIEENGGDYEKILSGDWKEMSRLGIIAHLKMQEYCNSLDTINYHEYRLPEHKDVLALSKKDVDMWAEKFSHISDTPLDRFQLQVLAALQNGGWDFFDDERNKYAAYDAFTRIMGEDCEVSFTNIDRRDELRRLACAKSLPKSVHVVSARRTAEDFMEKNPPKKREEYAPVRYK